MEDERNFTLRHPTDPTHEAINVSLSQKQDGSLEWVGLPHLIRREMSVFNPEEIQKHPETLLKVILRKDYKPKEVLMRQAEASELVQQSANIKQENPSHYYKVIAKIGEGGYGRVFRVKHL